MERHFRQDSISMKRLMPYFFIGPALLALVALVVYPLLYGVYISFFKTNLANKWDFVGLKNYISVFSDGVFVKQLGVTLKFTAIVVLAHFIIGIFLYGSIQCNICGFLLAHVQRNFAAMCQIWQYTAFAWNCPNICIVSVPIKFSSV